MLTTYHVGGFLPNAPAQNKAAHYDDQAQTVTTWNEAGAILAARPYTAEESARAASEAAAATAESNRGSLVAKAEAAIALNATFLAIASPTNAQTLTQVQRLTRENTAIIRLLVNRLEDTSGT